ncbi:MAG: hypothetical protein AAGG07_14050 [Planctomycetota bacterium]
MDRSDLQTLPAPRRVLAVTAALGLAMLTGWASGCASGQRSISMLKADGNEALFLEQSEQAIEAYSEWVSRQPYLAEARAALTRAYLQAGRNGDAREQAEIAVRLEEDNREYLDLLAEAMYRSGDEAALVALLRMRVDQSGTPADYIRLGDFAIKLGTPDEAEQAYLAAARVDKGQTLEPQMTLAEFYRTVGDEAKETRRLRMVLFIEPLNEDARTRLRELDQIPGPGIALMPEEARPAGRE